MSNHILAILGRRGPEQCRVQFVTPAGTRESSFAEIWDLSTRFAGAIRDGAPGRVAGILTPSPEMIACFVGTMRAGRDFVSLPLPARGQDLAAYARHLRNIQDAAHVGALVVESAYAGMLRSLPGGFVPVVAERLAERTAALQGDPEPGQLIQFSSGTTGAPKGVLLGGEAIAASVEATLDALGVGGTPESFCSWLPLSHDFGLIGGLLCTWVACGRTRPGYRYTCISPELFMTRPAAWMEACADSGATITTGPTFAYHVARRHLERGPALDLSRLRACVVGAEPIGAETLQELTAAGSRHGLRERSLCPAYGLAEVCLGVSMVRPGEAWTTREVTVEGHKGSYVSCGRVIGCVTIGASPIGSGAGPIRVSGPAMCSGYVPERAAFAPDGWLDTGDLGVMADGDLIVTGRSDDLVCVSGRNVFAWELERAACGVPVVRPGDCAVLTDGRGRYVVLFEPRGEDASGLDEAIVEVRRRLAAVVGIGPSAVGCLPRGALAKTPSGKIQRNRMGADLAAFKERCTAYREF